MKYLTLVLTLLLAPPLLQARDITQCLLSFHGVNANNQIDPKPYLDASHIKKIETQLHQQSGKQAVYVTFTAEGARINKTYTEKNIGKSIAIYCDGELLSKPRIFDITESEVVFTLK